MKHLFFTLMISFCASGMSAQSAQTKPTLAESDKRQHTENSSQQQVIGNAQPQLGNAGAATQHPAKKKEQPVESAEQNKPVISESAKGIRRKE